MLTLMKVQCPHCGIEGQVMAPNAGALIVGPCPECHRLVAIFAGEALALDDKIMNSASIEEKFSHLRTVLFNYVEGRVRDCFAIPSDTTAKDAPPLSNESQPPALTDPFSEMTPISDADYRHFVQHDIDDLDNPEFFDRLF